MGAGGRRFPGPAHQPAEFVQLLGREGGCEFREQFAPRTSASPRTTSLLHSVSLRAKQPDDQDVVTDL